MNPDSQTQNSNRKPLIVGIIAIAVLVLVIGGISMASKEDEPADKQDTSQATSQRTDAEDTPAATSDDEEVAYKDGTYTGSGQYTSPGGTEDVEVELTLEGNTITDVTVTTDPASPTSQQYQGEFKSGYKDMVVGKNIEDVKLSKVSGSSLTSQGFNAAIQQIKQQAQGA